jgi:type I restriction enzyme, R subunit
MSQAFTESTVEDAALELFSGLGYAILHGPDIAPGELLAERASYSDVLLIKRLKEALTRINPKIPAEAIEDAVRKLLSIAGPSLEESNRRFHRFLTDGVPVEYREKDRVVHDQVQLFDFKNPANNEWLAVNQFTVIEDRNNRRPDVVIFVNGLPLGVIELKNLADENATIRDAYNQLQTYKKDIPSLFPYNEALVISDGIEARLGTLTSGWERFMPWRTIEGDKVAANGSLELEVLIRGVFEKRRFLDLIRHFVVFESTGSSVEKKIAGYH